MAATITHPALMNTDEAARYLGVAPSTLAQWRHHRRHDLPYVRVGRAIRYRRCDLDGWLASRVVQPTQPKE